MASPSFTTNPERVRQLVNPFRVERDSDLVDPRVVASLQPRAEISERLRRICSQFQTDALLGDEMTISSLMSWSIFIDLRSRSWDKFSAFHASEIPKQSRTRT